MKKFFSLVLALVMALSLTTVAWGATEIYVDGSYTGGGSDGTQAKPYTTIQDAVDVAGTGDTIKVAYSATEYETFEVPADKTNLTVVGVPDTATGKYPVVKTMYQGIAGAASGYSGGTWGGIEMRATGFKMQYMDVVSYGYGYGPFPWACGAICQNLSNIGADVTGFTVDHCNFTFKGGDGTNNSYAIFLTTPTITITNCSFDGFAIAYGAMGDGTKVDTITITNNTFSVVDQAVVGYWGGASGTGSVTVKDNTVVATGDDNLPAIDLWDYANTNDSSSGSAFETVDVSNNTVSGTTAAEVVLRDADTGLDVTADTGSVVNSYSSVAKGVELDPAATEISVNYGTSSEATYTEQSNGTWLDDNGTEYDAAGGSSRTVVAKVGNTTYETLAAAVAAAQDGDTIVLLANTAENVTVNKNVIIVPNGKTTGTVSAGTNYDVIKTNGVYVVAPKTSAAGTTTTLKNADKYDIYAVGGTTSVKATKADITKKVTSDVSVTQDGKTTVTYTATTYSDGANVYVEVDSTVATHKLTKNGVIVAYMVNLADVGEVPVTTETVDSYVKAVEKPACGEYNKATYANGVYMIDGKAYAAGGANWALLNGKFVNYGAKATAVAHTYAPNTYSTSVKDALATVKCPTCKQVWNVLTVDQVKTMAPSAYAYVDVTDGSDQYIELKAAPSAPSTDVKVESADTFDAGIAMYVGMSVMAAAGSVVVLKKRED